MAFLQDVTNAVDTILGAQFEERRGNVVPTSESVGPNGAVQIEAAFLYADLAGSSHLADVCPWDVTAKIIRAYLDCATRIMREFGGEVRSFDGDRVMAVFIGNAKRTNAAKAALKIRYTLDNIIQPRAYGQFESIRNNGIFLKQACGVDCGWAHAVRAGIRQNNDLIWIGKAPSFAAKLSDIRDWPNSTFISPEVYHYLNPVSKFCNLGHDMWEPQAILISEKYEIVYQSKYQWGI